MLRETRAPTFERVCRSDCDLIAKPIRRVFQVLELFRSARRPLAVKQVAHELTYPISSTSILLKGMSHLGYLMYDRITRTYFTTPRVAFLGDWIEPAKVGSQTLSALCVKVRDATGETVAISMQNDVRMQIVHIAHSMRTPHVDLEPGQSLSLISTGIGLTMLSTKPIAEIRRLASRAREVSSSPPPIASLAELVADATWVRRAGFVTTYDQIVAGVGEVAMPLPLTPAGVQLILCVAGPTDRVRERKREIIDGMSNAISKYLPERCAQRTVVTQQVIRSVP